MSTFFLLFLSICPYLANGQTCVSTACSAFVATYTSCTAVFNTAQPLPFIDCVCKNGSAFDGAVLSCYNCDKTFANASLIEDLQELLNFCDLYSTDLSEPTATATGAASATGNIVTILNTLTSASSSGPPSTSTAKTSSGTMLVAPGLQMASFLVFLFFGCRVFV
jgi:hypothetical protein